MSADIQGTFEKAYTSSEIAKLVGIAAPTVRKYSQILEKHGYEFIKNGERRVFVEKDIDALKQMKKSSNLENTAVDLVKEQKGDTSNTELDIKRSDMTVSPSDMALIAKELEQKLALSNERYKNLFNKAEKMQDDLAATKETVDNISLELEEAKKREEEKEQTINDMNDKLQKAVDFILEMEKKEKKKEKKSLLKRIFG